MIREETFSLGSIIKTHGLKGELLLITSAGFENMHIKTELVFLETDGQLVPFFLEQLEITGASTAILKVEDINSLEKAKEWVGKEIFVPAGSVKKPKKKILPESDLEGFKVFDRKHGNIGIIRGILDYKNNPVMRIVKNKKEILIPFQSVIIIKVDRQKHHIEIDAPEGLIELYL